MNKYLEKVANLQEKWDSLNNAGKGYVVYNTASLPLAGGLLGYAMEKAAPVTAFQAARERAREVARITEEKVNKNTTRILTDHERRLRGEKAFRDTLRNRKISSIGKGILVGTGIVPLTYSAALKQKEFRKEKGK